MKQVKAASYVAVLVLVVTGLTSIGAKEVQAIFGSNPERVYSRDEDRCVKFIRDTILKQDGARSSLSAFIVSKGPPKIFKGTIFYRGSEDRVQISNGEKMKNETNYDYICEIDGRKIRILEITKY